MNEEWFKDPKILLLGAVGVGVVFILMRNKGSAAQPQTQNIGFGGMDASMVPPSNGAPLGAYSSALDGSGSQHLSAAMPYNGVITPWNTGYIDYTSVNHVAAAPSYGSTPGFIYSQ